MWKIETFSFKTEVYKVIKLFATVLYYLLIKYYDINKNKTCITFVLIINNYAFFKYFCDC